MSILKEEMRMANSTRQKQLGASVSDGFGRGRFSHEGVFQESPG